MGVYALTSIAGAPGVTTTAVAWAMTSGRPTVVIEADLTGGSPILAGVFRSEKPHTTSLLALSTRPAGTTLLEQLWDQAIGFPGGRERYLVPGIAEATQASALTPLWEPLGAAAQELSQESGVDVIIDAGRLHRASALTPLLAAADTVLVCTWSHLVGLHTAVTGLDQLRRRLGDITADRVGIVAVTSATQSFSHSAVAKVMAPSPVLAQLPWAPAAAGHYFLGAPAPRKGERRKYTRAIAALAAAAEQQATLYHATTLGDIA